MKRRPVIGITLGISGGKYRINEDYVESVARAGGAPRLIPPIEGGGVRARELDGLLLSGGDDIPPDYFGETVQAELKLEPRRRCDFEIRLVHEIIELRKPVLGICYGMQLLNVARGGTILQDIESMLDHRKGTHEIEIRENPLIPSGTFSVRSDHHQAVSALGDGLEALGHCLTDGVVEAMYMPGTPFVLCIQWHPERSVGDGISGLIFREFMEAASEG